MLRHISSCAKSRWFLTVLILFTLLFFASDSLAIYCTQCGSKNADDALYCSQCGHKITGGSDPGYLLIIAYKYLFIDDLPLSEYTALMTLDCDPQSENPWTILQLPAGKRKITGDLHDNLSTYFMLRPGETLFYTGDHKFERDKTVSHLVEQLLKDGYGLLYISGELGLVSQIFLNDYPIISDIKKPTCFVVRSGNYRFGYVSKTTYWTTNLMGTRKRVDRSPTYSKKYIDGGVRINEDKTSVVEFRETNKIEKWTGGENKSYTYTLKPKNYDFACIPLWNIVFIDEFK